MASIRCAIILAVVVFGLIQDCASFLCYECELTKCNQNLTTMTRSPCDSNRQCFQLVNPETDTVIKRGCADKGFCEIFADCKMCAEELCNASSQTVPFLGIISCLGVILLKLYIM